MLCASKGDYFRGTAGYCNMTCRSMKSGQKFQQAQWNHAKLSREKNGSESSTESVSESKRKGAETRVKAGDQQWERGVEGGEA